MSAKKQARPLVPAQCDVSNFPSMFLDVRRFMNSEMWMLGSDQERVAALNLIMESWAQKPTGSIPKNDRMLAVLSRAQDWKAVKKWALRNWQDGGDGRLYHPVVCEKALMAWIEKLGATIYGAAGNKKRWKIQIDVVSLQEQLSQAQECLKYLNSPDHIDLEKKIKKLALTVSQRLGGESGGESGGDSTPESGSVRNEMIGEEMIGEKEKINKKENFDDDDLSSKLFSFGGLHLSELPSAWERAVTPSTDVKNLWLGFRGYYVDKFQERDTVQGWFEKWCKWADNPLSVSMTVDPTYPPPAAPEPPKKAKRAPRILEGLDKLMFEELVKMGCKLTIGQIDDMAEAHQKDRITIFRDLKAELTQQEGTCPQK